jgi:hypothetical protein
MRAYERVLLVFSMIVMFGALGWAIYVSPAGKALSSAGWTLSAVALPPDDRPIVGLWMEDAQPVVIAVVGHGRRYFGYDALHPEGPLSPLESTPPVWWVDFPGGAR